ncbi:aldose epimerase family protein [Kushneria aurantia]|uniref:Aldose 1-epimerase n=1 Tax=Kushneria aurantia TaxID=504092 RepID=A0ABV6G176_9GAMM|nr:aldose epimerase family protein [Kushneria aurantia]
MSLHCLQDQVGRDRHGRPFQRFRLANSAGMQIDILDYGATLASLRVPTEAGDTELVVGFDDPADYEQQPHPYFGALVGRYANRIGGACFSLDGADFHIPPNEGRNALHGGPEGLSEQRWRGELFESAEKVGVTLRYHSADGEMGFPGNLEVAVHYSLDEHSRLCIDYEASSDAATVVSLTNHSYFNLGGADVRRYRLQCHASRYLVIDDEMIPTGEVASVNGTPFDFREPAVIGERARLDNPQLAAAGGHDVALVLDGVDDATPVATLDDPDSGRRLELFTDQPSLQLYTGTQLDASLIGHGGRPIEAFSGIALEAQRYPDAPNHDNFPSARLNRGESYTQHSCYRFHFDRSSTS